MSIFKRITEKLRKVKKKFAYTLVFAVTVVMGVTLIVTVRSVINLRREKALYLNNQQPSDD